MFQLAGGYTTVPATIQAGKRLDQYLREQLVGNVVQQVIRKIEVAVHLKLLFSCDLQNWKLHEKRDFEDLSTRVD